MATFWRGIRAAAAMALLGAGAVTAQDAPRGLALVREGNRAGFWMGLGMGPGAQTFDLRDGAGYSDELYGPTLSLRVGGTPSQNLRLGGEILGWYNQEGIGVQSLSSVMVVGQLYPSRKSGLYLKGGAGVGRSALDYTDGFSVGNTGFAGLVGAGWEVRVGRRFYLNPAVDVVQHYFGGGRGEAYRERLVNLSLGVLYQRGR